MLTKRVVTATEARTNLFDLLKRAENGEDVIIVKRDSNKKFKLSAMKREDKSIDKLLDEFAKIGLRTMPLGEMKRIISTRLDEK